jgi:hypothetical protein
MAQVESREIIDVRVILVKLFFCDPKAPEKARNTYGLDSEAVRVAGKRAKEEIL